ncbi:TonB-dependent receptor [Pedobacter xixiisoli]|uniref:Iron complex outermembrane recepter protein n=1 Tax=Pedobacter xixiisoli TaxID=1476464 RepID=A0A285ZSW0_9SPHI|nr:TonB-dependent receptor [Pedobacter xixiisoli]SOD12732.1 iron complex outermembrane recepter protein [Pedobacter xixiisoli]
MKKITILLFLIFPIVLFGQRAIKGNVKGADGNLIGVSISTKDNSQGTLTDSQGNFKLTVSDKATTLVFTFLGYVTKEVVLDQEKEYQVFLDKETKQLKEVAVKGFSGVIGQARRRLESVQSVPESVVTLTSQEIESKGIVNVQTFANTIPNVNFTTSQGVGNNFITVRGISHIRNGESPIAFVIDGVTLPDANLINQELFDLAMIEIVKGPQGALYGKNAIAGAINITTNQPTNDFSNKISLGYGSGNLFKTQLSFSGPIMKDKLFYRVSGSYRKGDGVIKNTYLNKPVDYIEDLSLRAQIKANLSNKINATATGQIINTKAGATYYAAGVTTPNFGADDFNNQAVIADQFGTSKLKGNYGNLKVNFDLEGVTLTSSTTYNKSDRNHTGDLDFTSADILRQFQNSDSKTFNQEIKLSSKNKETTKLTWDLGAFYQNSAKLLYTQATADFGFFAPPYAPTGAQSTLAVSDFTNTYSTLAAFGFVDYKVTDKFTVSAGLRYDNDHIKQDNRTLNTKPDKTDSQLQPKLSLSLKATENMLLYTNYGRGYRSGGFNQANTVRFNEGYEAEITNNYEFGIKNSFLNNRIILNLSTYYIDFKNQQQYALLINGSGNILIGNFNFPKSESYGFEADFKIRATNYLDILASYGLSKSIILEGTSTYSVGANNSFNVAKKNTPLVPQNSYVLALESNFNLTKKVSFNGNLTLRGTGKIYWHEDNRAISSAYNLLSSKVGIAVNGFAVNVFGNNILNQKYITEYFGQDFSNGSGDLAWKGQPAVFGVDFSYKF